MSDEDKREENTEVIKKDEVLAENTQNSAEEADTTENNNTDAVEQVNEATAEENNAAETKAEVENESENAAETVESEKIEEKPEKTVKKSNKKTSKKNKNTKKEKTEDKTENDVASKTEKSEKSEEKGKKAKASVKFSEIYEKYQSSIALLIIVSVAAFIIMVAAALSVFFLNVKGHEQVLVPNVVGKQLEDALIDMQVKELYPKINLRYSNTPGDEGTILEQSPEAGAIVRGYSRVNLVVSRGIVVDKIGNYVGMNIEELKMNLQTLFAGQTKPLIVLADPEYKPDVSDAGTILEQDPPEGTDISQPVTVKLIVSRGPNYDNTRAPNVMGQSVNDVLQTIARSKIIFDFTSHIAAEDEKPGTVVKQDVFESDYVPNYSHVNVEFAFPEKQMNDNVYGIFKTELTEYPYPVQMRIDAVPSEGSAYTILNFLHSGGSVTVPYAVPAGTKLVLYVVDKETASLTVN